MSAWRTWRTWRTHLRRRARFRPWTGSTTSAVSEGSRPPTVAPPHAASCGAPGIWPGPPMRIWPGSSPWASGRCWTCVRTMTSPPTDPTGWPTASTRSRSPSLTTQDRAPASGRCSRRATLSPSGRPGQMAALRRWPPMAPGRWSPTLPGWPCSAGSWTWSPTRIGGRWSGTARPARTGPAGSAPSYSWPWAWSATPSSPTTWRATPPLPAGRRPCSKVDG